MGQAIRKKPFLHHNDWTDALTYKSKISWPAFVLAEAEPEAMLAYVQTRALVGGTTSIQGWPGFNRPPLMVLRNIDDEKAGTTSRNLIYTSALTENTAQRPHRTVDEPRRRICLSLRGGAARLRSRPRVHRCGRRRLPDENACGHPLQCGCGFRSGTVAAADAGA